MAFMVGKRAGTFMTLGEGAFSGVL
jgi:hypothetical protein